MTTAHMTTTQTTGFFASLADWLPGVDALPVLAAGVVQVLCLIQLF